MEFQPRMSVVVGVQDAWQNVARIVDRFASSGVQAIEVIICHASDDRPPAALVLPQNCALLEGPAEALVPELWALGIRSARGDRVAILSANCIPDAQWIQKVATLDLATHVAYGGAIELPDSASARDAAIHILRYCSVTPPQPKRQIRDVAADNSVYRRAEIIRHDDLLSVGFWEPSFHSRFRADGLTMAFEPELAAAHVNTYSTRDFLSRRFEHGQAFGQERMARFRPWRRVAMLILAPLAVAYFVAKVIGRGIASPGLRWRLPSSLPWLLLFIGAWSLGELWGYVGSAFRVDGTHGRKRAGAGSGPADEDAADRGTVANHE